MTMYYDLVWENVRHAMECGDIEKEVLYTGLGHALTVECSVV